MQIRLGSLVKTDEIDRLVIRGRIRFSLNDAFLLAFLSVRYEQDKES